jgi:C4-type Zn-finger protein
LDASAVLDQELTQIEGLLDQLEAKASTASNIDNEMTFL